jgi:hypothetical protein
MVKDLHFQALWSAADRYSPAFPFWPCALGSVHVFVSNRTRQSHFFPFGPGAELCCQTVASSAEQKQRVMAGRLEVHAVGTLLLLGGPGIFEPLRSLVSGKISYPKKGDLP